VKRLAAPVLGLFGALMLIASAFADTFEYRAGDAVIEVSRATDRHDYAFLLLGLFAFAAILIAVGGSSRPAAIAIAATGGAALLLFLIADLPDAGSTATFTGFVQAKAHPMPGFWLELVGAIFLLICGAALALKPQPATIRRRAEHQSTRTQGT
jgi:hypothetical protein